MRRGAGLGSSTERVPVLAALYECERKTPTKKRERDGGDGSIYYRTRAPLFFNSTDCVEKRTVVFGQSFRERRVAVTMAALFNVSLGRGEG